MIYLDTYNAIQELLKGFDKHLIELRGHDESFVLFPNP